ERVREVNLARYHRRFGKTGPRPGAGGQSTGAGAGAASIGHVSGISAVSMAECVRQRDVRFEIETRFTQSGTARGRKVLSSSGRPRKIHGSQRSRALGRHETARGTRSSTGAEPAGVTHGRTVRRAGCNDTRTTLR